MDLETVGVGPGWRPIVGELIEALQDMGFNPDTDIQQIKEKFGGLRFYCDLSNIPEEHHDYAIKLIDYAENLSYTRCEDCGERGETRTDLSWILTLCDTHYKETKDAN